MMSNGMKGTVAKFGVAQKIMTVCYGDSRTGKHQVCAHMQICKGEYERIADSRRGRTVGSFVWKALNRDEVRRWRNLVKFRKRMHFILMHLMRINLKGNIEKQGKKYMIRYAISRKEKYCRK